MKPHGAPRDPIWMVTQLSLGEVARLERLDERLARGEKLGVSDLYCWDGLCARSCRTLGERRADRFRAEQQ